MPRTLFPATSLDRLTPAARADALFVPGLAPFPPALRPLLGLLPVLDVNGALLVDLAARRPFRAAPPIAAVFACDPFLRPADLGLALSRAGIAEVANHPSVQGYGGEAAAALSAVGYRAEAEFRLLAGLAAQGFSPIAVASSEGAVDAALALGLRRVLLQPAPGTTPPPGWWARLASRVAVEGGEALAWSDSPPRAGRRVIP
jgi:hypothetical protein